MPEIRLRIAGLCSVSALALGIAHPADGAGVSIRCTTKNGKKVCVASVNDTNSSGRPAATKKPRRSKVVKSSRRTTTAITTAVPLPPLTLPPTTTTLPPLDPAVLAASQAKVTAQWLDPAEAAARELFADIPPSGTVSPTGSARTLVLSSKGAAARNALMLLVGANEDVFADPTILCQSARHQGGGSSARVDRLHSD